MAKDPVCGMEVDATRAKLKTKHKGKMYYFCGAGCQYAFRNNPKAFLR